MKNIAELGQVFTPQEIVEKMLKLSKNSNNLLKRFLEPSCGDGAFFNALPKNKIGIEIDKNVIPNNSNILNIDFFDYPLNETFDTIIGNPPYVRFQDINSKTKEYLKPFYKIFDSRTNLYLFFIYKSILHLNKGGELIFITPRDFLKNTSAVKLNNFLFSNGTLTHFFDLGDKKIFKTAQPNCAIWRFEKDNFSHRTVNNCHFLCVHGQLFFTKQNYPVFFNDLFFVKVGAVSGADFIFENNIFGNTDFVYSQTAKTGKTKRMVYNVNIDYLKQFKNQLLNRKIKKFDENNFWQWGRDYFKSDAPRIYVNAKTRNPKPFFLHACTAYDGSVLAIFPRFKTTPTILQKLCELLNAVDWQELGFVCDGRFLFSQRSLEKSILPQSFQAFQLLPKNPR